MKAEFIKLLEGLDRSKGREENFRNFCEMNFCALAKKTAHDEERANQLEERYMSIVHGYNNKDDVREMPKLSALSMQALHMGGCDFLGEIGALDTRNGQFFTPYDVSKMMALITFGGFENFIEEDGFFSVSDPAAGAGCMILAAADMIEEKGYSVMDTMSAHVTELSRLTYHMLYVQLSLRGIPAAVINGNSLSLEIFDSAYTPAMIPFLGRHGSLFKENKEPEQSSAPIPDIQITPILNPTQLSLFG